MKFYQFWYREQKLLAALEKPTIDSPEKNPSNA